VRNLLVDREVTDTTLRQASYFTPPREDVAKAFNMTYDLSVWGQDPKTRIYASWPTSANAGISKYKHDLKPQKLI
jgi:hypothetical protein